MTIELSKTEKAILRDIALKGERTIYDVAVKDKIASRSTVSKALEKFEKHCLVEIKREEPFKKIEENIKRYYGLTFRGLVAALKMEDVKFHLVKDAEALIDAWIKKSIKLEDVLRLRQKLRATASWETFEKAVIEYVKKFPEETASFLKHYDLEFSDDMLIYPELVIRAVSRLSSFFLVNRMKKRQFEKLMSLAPEFEIYFMIPQLWNLSRKVTDKMEEKN